MKKNFVSDEWKIGCRGHENFEFIDVDLNDDNLLFIDPCLIENWDVNWAQKATVTIKSFFEEFYRAYHNNDNLLKYNLLSHAREQNSTRLGYGKGNNGKGNTPEGLIKDFKPLEVLIHQIITIETPQDISILIPGFAEDGFSDLLTNIIHKELNEFTLEQMKKYKKLPNDTVSFYSWDSTIKNWIKIESPCYKYAKNEILLVPKRIVRKNYLFGVGQYFTRIILERKREEDNWRDSKGKLIPKREVEKNLRTDTDHWKYEYVIEYTKEHSDALEEYHKKLPSFYFEHGQPMEDDELDATIYG